MQLLGNQQMLFLSYYQGSRPIALKIIKIIAENSI